MENRKKIESQFHNVVRDKSSEEFEYRTSNRKFYSVAIKRENFVNDFLKKNCFGKKALDYCCGDGPVSLFLAENGADTYGIDISPVSIRICNERAVSRGVSSNTHFFVMDAEKMEFEDNFFDLIAINGVLHHLDIEKSLKELSRVLKPTGKIICTEPLVYNPVFHLYRLITPQLRTEWEIKHILGKKEINIIKKYFNGFKAEYFDLVTLIAVPFRETALFNPVLSVLEFFDSLILKIPGVKWWAWQIVFILSNPKK